MSDTDFQKVVLSEFQNIHSELKHMNTRFDTLEGRFDTLEGKVDTLGTELHEFQESQAQHNINVTDAIQSLWTLSEQSFDAINTIQQEVVSPWKLRSHHKS